MLNKLLAKLKVDKKKFITVICMVISILLGPVNVYAANAELVFGSEEYEQKSGSEFHVGAYIKADQPIGEYNVQIKYDNLRLKLVDGASNVDEENGIITFSGNERKSELKFWLKFRAISGGEASLEFVDSTIDDYEIITYGVAPIHISGEDTAASLEEMEAGQEEESEDVQQEEELPQKTEPEVIQDTSTHNEEQAQVSTGSPITQKKSSILYNVFFIATVAVLGISILVVSIVWGIINAGRKKEKEHVSKLDSIKQKKDLPVEDLSVEELNGMMENIKKEVQTLMDNSEKYERGEEKPVIKVCDVTMEFHLSSINPSGLKEYMIQLLKREVKYKRLFALYHVSFNVYKGEIVGIIGTNGSGKSTLLKIVSGALKPTSGYVEVDRKKIQLLTLGTGFDMELTARENVFLNGSIIGYSREFLESHYDEIVEFAELQDFMDQKVKNFSSGMVSRLGFAIATAGDAAEILILDEVLSVGDEFFRQKSLKRVKEMIHGGSTVLMVSHGMGTIIDNCTKCVWIEKGELRMIGEPKEVCAEYKKMNK